VTECNFNRGKCPPHVGEKEGGKSCRVPGTVKTSHKRKKKSMVVTHKIVGHPPKGASTGTEEQGGQSR